MQIYIFFASARTFFDYWLVFIYQSHLASHRLHTLCFVAEEAKAVLATVATTHHPDTTQLHPSVSSVSVRLSYLYFRHLKNNAISLLTRSISKLRPPPLGDYLSNFSVPTTPWILRNISQETSLGLPAAYQTNVPDHSPFSTNTGTTIGLALFYMGSLEVFIDHLSLNHHVRMKFHHIPWILTYRFETLNGKHLPCQWFG